MKESSTVKAVRLPNEIIDLLKRKAKKSGLTFNKLLVNGAKLVLGIKH